MWNPESIRCVEEKDFNAVANRCGTDGNYITRAVSVWHEEILCGYFITCTSLGVRTFHGFKFVKGGLEYQIPMARKYIEEESLEYSVFKTKETEAVLKVLGFRKIATKDGWSIAKKYEN